MGAPPAAETSEQVCTPYLFKGEVQTEFVTISKQTARMHAYYGQSQCADLFGNAVTGEKSSNFTEGVNAALARAGRAANDAMSTMNDLQFACRLLPAPMRRRSLQTNPSPRHLQLELHVSFTLITHVHAQRSVVLCVCGSPWF